METKNRTNRIKGIFEENTRNPKHPTIPEDEKEPNPHTNDVSCTPNVKPQPLRSTPPTPSSAVIQHPPNHLDPTSTPFSPS